MKLITLLFAFVFTDGFAHAQSENFEWNVRTAPLTLVVGANLRVDRRLTDELSLGVSGLYIDRKIKAVGILESSGAVIIQYSFSGALATGWFLDAAVGYGDIKATAASAAGQEESRQLHNVSARVVGGYMWFWHNWNVSLGGGFAHNSAGDNDVEDANGKSMTKIPVRKNLFVPEFSLGWAW